MFAIEVELLARRYTATAFNERAASEWPPHPARLYSALVAAWSDDDHPSEQERDALRWFEAQGPPVITCAGGAGCLERDAVTHFVPVNDARSLVRDVSGGYQALVGATSAAADAGDDRARSAAERAVAKALAKAVADGESAGRLPAAAVSASVVAAATSVLPELRGRQGRTFPTIRIADGASATLRYVWPEAEASPPTATALDGLLARVGRLGHSSTFVSCRLVTTGAVVAASGQHQWRPEPAGGDPGGDTLQEVNLRAPALGSLDRLMAQHESHAGREPRTLVFRSFWYQAGAGSEKGPVPRSVLAGPWRVLVLARPDRVRLTRTLDVTRAVRGALLSGSGDRPPFLLHGHAEGRTGERTVPGAKPHLSILPLANVGSSFGDGIVHGVALALPVDATAQDRDVLDTALSRWRARSQGDDLDLTFAGQSFALPRSGWRRQ